MKTLKLKENEILKNRVGKKNALIVCSFCAPNNFSPEQITEFAKEFNAEIIKSSMICNYPELIRGQSPRSSEAEPRIKINPKNYDSVLVLGCGAGVQAASEILDTRVIPVADTTGIAVKKDNTLLQYCTCCGNCVLYETGGICPITRCPKSMLNGPCGGVHGGKCEVDDRPCAWVLIYERMKKFGKTDEFSGTRMPPVK